MKTDKTNTALIPLPDRLPQILSHQAWDDRAVRILDAGVDTLYFSFDIMVNDEIYQRLLEEQQHARDVRDTRHAVYVSEWLNAGVSPMGANGYQFLIERKDKWAVRIQNNNPHQPGIFVEMRAYMLHTHPEGVLGACEEVCTFIQHHLFADDPLKADVIQVRHARCSRLDLHLDWQGGWHPSMETGEEQLFIKPARAGWHKYMEGDICLGYEFGKKRIMARIYNKTQQTTIKHLTWYPEYLKQRVGDAYNSEQSAWRLEYELKRDGVKGFYLETPPEISDPDDVVQAEMEGEDLPNIGSVPKALHWAAHLWGYLARRWLRLVIPDGDTNRARWPIHPTWQALQKGFAPAFALPPLTEHKTKLVRQHKHTGYSRALKRMALGVMASAELLLDSDPASVLPCFLEGVMHQAQAAKKVQEKKLLKKLLTAGEKRQLRYYEHVDHLAKMALGVFTSIGVTKGALPPMTSIGDLLEYLCDDLEEIANKKGGIGQMLYDKWCKVYKMLPIQHAVLTAGKVA
jgi:hypothetical protein